VRLFLSFLFVCAALRCEWLDALAEGSSGWGLETWALTFVCVNRMIQFEAR
jgi:hypothetical protein